jgi:hypothetical protein
MLYVTPSSSAFVIVQYIIVETDGLLFKPSEPFKNKYYDQEIDAYTDIADNGETSVRYFVLPTVSVLK